jgi:porin
MMRGSAISLFWHVRAASLVLLLVCSPGFAADYAFEASYTGDVLVNASGGIETGTRYLDNLDLKLEVDLDRIWGPGAGKLLVSGLYNNGSTFSNELVGDLQVVSNIDTAEAWRVYELWYELGDDSKSVRVGLYDLNSEFDVNETGALFLNSSHGIGPELGQTGLNGPGIFPVTSMSLRAALQLDSVTARIVVMDAVPGDPEDPASYAIDLRRDDGCLTVAELDMRLADSARIWAGYWRYSAEFEHGFGDGSDRGNDGWYVGLERSLAFGSHSGAWFVRLGQADERFNALHGYAGLGLVIDGPFPARSGDHLGFAVASARAGGPYRNLLDQSGAGAKRHETTWEMTYQAQINEYLVLQPDIQYVRNPAASASLDNAWVFGLRFVLTAGR